MFTGIVQRIGTVRRVSRGANLVLEIAFEPWRRPLEEGESIAVNGVCLTVARFDEAHFTADVLRETESRTGLGGLLPGSKVNLERALAVGDAMGGHIVQGHVDCQGVVLDRTSRGADLRLRIGCGRVLAAQSVLKGSIAIDGVSLTISALGDDFLQVDLIPTTRTKTTLGALEVGDKVNLEGDVIGKYVAKLVPRAGLTEDALRAAGFIG